jgi:hypothetical protein
MTEDTPLAPRKTTTTTGRRRATTARAAPRAPKRTQMPHVPGFGSPGYVHMIWTGTLLPMINGLSEGCQFLAKQVAGLALLTDQALLQNQYLIAERQAALGLGQTGIGIPGFPFGAGIELPGQAPKVTPKATQTATV